MLKPEHPPGTTSPGHKNLGPLATVTRVTVDTNNVEHTENLCAVLEQGTG